MTSAGIAVTARSFRQVPGEHHQLLAAAGLTVRFAEPDRPLAEDELVELVRGCWGMIVGVDPVSAAVLDAGPLRAVVRFGSGTDNVDLAAARERGITVAATPGANARSVAELAIGLLLALARHVVVHDRQVRSGTWSPQLGTELAGRRPGVVGYGALGRRVAATPCSSTPPGAAWSTSRPWPRPWPPAASAAPPPTPSSTSRRWARPCSGWTTSSPAPMPAGPRSRPSPEPAWPRSGPSWPRPPTASSREEPACA